MSALTQDYLIASGFVEEIKNQWNGEHKTGFYILEGWNPAPKIEGNLNATPLATIGALQWFIRSGEDLDKFINKAVPTYCELKSNQPIKQK